MNERRPGLAFVGTYTDGESEGVYGLQLDGDTGELEELSTASVGENPSFLAVHPNGEYLYAIHEVSPGSVTACATDRETGELLTLNSRPSGDDGPCHCSVDATGQFLLVAHFGGGSVSVLPIEDAGRLSDPTDAVEHDGTSVDPDDPPTPRPHAAVPGPENRFVYVPDLGLDEVVVYELDHERGTLDRTSSARVGAGTGPRHLVFHPDDRLAYVVNELESSVTVFERDAESGELAEIETVRTVPDDFDGTNHPADVHVHSSGRWVYASNRGHYSVATFDVDEESGRLELVETVSTAGECPRNFAIDPTETFLFAENQDTDDVVAFRITDAGRLEATGARTSLPSPVCLQFLG